MAGYESPKNYDNVFFRDVLLGLCKTMQEKISWTNVYDSQEKRITVPFVYSMTGDERFLLDAFVDDYAGTRLEMDYEPVPRAVVVQSAYTQKTSELTNQVRLVAYQEDEDGNVRKVYGKYRVVPMKFTYDVTIILSTEIDVMKCAQSIIEKFPSYTTFFFEYRYLRIDAVVTIPETQSTEIIRDINAGTESNKTMKFSLDVHVNLPIPSQDPATSYDNRIGVGGRTLTLGSRGSKRTYLGTDSEGETSKRQRPPALH